MITNHIRRVVCRSLSTAYYSLGVVHWSLVILALSLAACATPHSLPAGPTPIPTLIPATEPASPLTAATAPVFTIQSYPARLPSAALGQPIYQTHCARCHGVDGKGVIPGARNFSDLDYMRGETPAYFYTAITEGRGEMPSFRDTLTSDDRWDVTFFVWRFTTSTENLTLGKSLFETNCASCHGTDGTGKVLGATDFTDIRLVSSRAPRDFYLTVTQGKGSMPAWQGRLSQDERWAVIDYLLTFSYDPTLPEEVANMPSPTATTTVATTTVTTTAQATCDQTYLSQSNPYAWDDQEAIAAGKVIYTQSCVLCHGTDGAGVLPGTPNFTTAQTQSELRNHSGEFLCVLAEGRNAMPGWKERLSLDQMWQVLTYTGSLGK